MAERRAGGSTIELTVGRRRAAGAMVDIANGYRREGGAWVKVWPTANAPLQVTGPLSVSGFAAGGDPSGAVTSSNVTLSITGGSGSASVSWSRLSGSPNTFALSPSSATTAFRNNFVADGTPDVSTFRATVTDGSEVVTHDVSVTLTYEAF